jgi:hypothetical protein
MKKNKLHNVKSTGFETPDHYFESLEDKLFERLKETESIVDIETPGYTIPKDYFDTVENKIISKLSPEDKLVIRLKTRTTFYYSAGIAASFVLLFSLVFNNNDATSIDTIETSSLEGYLFQEDYNNDDLAFLFVGSEISESDFINVSISEETLNQYLDNTDTEDLIFE